VGCGVWGPWISLGKKNASGGAGRDWDDGGCGIRQGYHKKGGERRKLGTHGCLIRKFLSGLPSHAKKMSLLGKKLLRWGGRGPRRKEKGKTTGEGGR